MSESLPKSLSIEEAVAWIINYELPLGYSVLVMTNEYINSAEQKYYVAIHDKASKDEVSRLKSYVEACKARHIFSQNILDHITEDYNNRHKGGWLKKASDSTGTPRLTLESVAEWADFHYGIGWSRFERLSVSTDASMKDTKKSDLTTGSLYTTFAYLIDAFVDVTGNDYLFTSSKELNVSKLAKHISGRASILDDVNDGQGSESIRKRINDALKSK